MWFFFISSISHSVSDFGSYFQSLKNMTAVVPRCFSFTKVSFKDWHASKPKRLSDLRVSGIHDYSLLKPLSFYTADSTFQVCSFAS